MLLRRTVFDPPLNVGGGISTYVSVDGVESDSGLRIGVLQETSIGGDASISFRFTSEKELIPDGKPISVQVAFVTASGGLSDASCLANDNSMVRLGRVDYTSVQPTSQRAIEITLGDDYGFEYDSVYKTDAKTQKARAELYRKLDIYRFNIESGYQDDPGGPTSVRARATIDSSRARASTMPAGPPNRNGLPSSFYCVLPRDDVWRSRSRGTLESFAPQQIVVPPTATLLAQVNIARDVNFIATSKPDGTETSRGQWVYTQPIVKAGTANGALSDYFVFEQIGRQNRQEQYSFWLGLAVSFTVTFLGAIARNLFRIWTGRIAVFDLVKDD